MHQNLKAFIIGSGIAGIASAIRLAVQGLRVTVFEKNSIAGGKIDLIEKANYCFDSGPTLFTHPQYIEDLFALTNEKIENYFSYKPVEIACKYFYEDGTVINAYANAEKLKNELEEKTGEPKENIRRYLKSSEKAYNNIGNIFLNYSLHKRKTVRRVAVLKALISIKPSLIFSSLNELNTRSFSKPQTIQLFNRYATYNGSNPYKAPAMLSVIPHLEYNEGIFYPQGGMISIIHSLYRLAVKMGVIFQFNSPVQYIIVHEQMAIGIVVNDENHFSDAVISNGDLYFTYKQLLQDEKKAQKILKQERSSSAIIFYWGMKKEFPQLQLHNIFFSKNYKEEFDFIFKRRQLYHDPTVYINITSKQEPSVHAPLQKENWFVMINVPSSSTQNWNELKRIAKQNIIKKLNRLLQTDIEPFIEIEETADPLTIEANTSSYMGAIYGASSNTRLAAFLRHPNFSRSIKRLYFTGGSVHPGGGVPLCLQSAKIVCDIIGEDKKKWQKEH